MKVRTALLLAASLIVASGCGEDTSSNNTVTDSSSQTINEVTRIDELPAFLSEGMTAEEVAELREQILPETPMRARHQEKNFRRYLQKQKMVILKLKQIWA